MSDDRLAQARSQLPGWVARMERNYAEAVTGITNLRP